MPDVTTDGPPYLIISFHGYNEQVRVRGRDAETLGTVDPRLVIQRATSVDAAVMHIAKLNRELRDDPHRDSLQWAHVVVAPTLATIVDADGDFDDFTHGFDIGGDRWDRGYLPDSWRERIARAIATLDDEAAAAIADRNRRAREAAEQRQREAAERARLRADADAAAAAAAAEAHDRVEFARLLAKYGNEVKS